MGIIKVMDPHLSNMIAAGEVVDRPVNIVKECVENSLDAGASAISIEVFEGGIQGIIVTDDGCGMDEEDARMAFARHATSKLYDEAELFNIQTMGFRGEALASIAAVSIVDLRTSNKGHGTHIRYEYGEMTELESAACPRGTRVEVRGLFVKTPARFKYLRKAAYEFSVIAETVNKLAIAHPDIRFILKHDNRLIFQTSGKGDKREIMYQMFGRDAAGSALEFYGQSDDFVIEGLAVQPKISRANKHFIYITVNDRLVRNYTVTKAVLEGYGEYMPKDRYPIIFINIKVDPQLVDVNVHPNKMEVRLSKEEYLGQLIINTLENLFSENLTTVEIAKLSKPSAMQQKMEFEYPQPMAGRTAKKESSAKTDKQDASAGSNPSNHADSRNAGNRPGSQKSGHNKSGYPFSGGSNGSMQVRENKAAANPAPMRQSFGPSGYDGPASQNEIEKDNQSDSLRGHPFLHSTVPNNHQESVDYLSAHPLPQKAVMDDLRAQYGGRIPAGALKEADFDSSLPAGSFEDGSIGRKNLSSNGCGDDFSKDSSNIPGEAFGKSEQESCVQDHPAENEFETSQSENTVNEEIRQSADQPPAEQLLADQPLADQSSADQSSAEQLLQERSLEDQLVESQPSAQGSAQISPSIGYPVPGVGQNKEVQKGNAFFESLKVIGQLKDSYILCENAEGLVIIDQHAAQERYHFEQLEDAFSRPTTMVQPLIVPLRLNVTPDLMAQIDTINDSTRFYGLEFEAFGKDSLILRQMPSWLAGLKPEEFLYDLLAGFKAHGKIDITAMNRHMLATAACHSSIRFNRKLCMEEMEQVVADLCKCRQPFHCPHGRPTVITLSESQMRKEFERG